MNRDQQLKRNIVAVLTMASGLAVMGSVLRVLLHRRQITDAISDDHLAVLAGVSLVYLASLLRRGKYNAWLISLGVYIYLGVRSLVQLGGRSPGSYLLVYIAAIILPFVTLSLLVVWRAYFVSHSSLASFTLALRRAAIVLVVTFLYGTVGFQLFDKHDFHQEISLTTAMHYTADQFGLTTNDKPVAYTKRSIVFIDSLAVASIAAAAYVAVSFFGPIRFRLTHNQRDKDDAARIIQASATTSEDFFKLWPPDKAYFFNQTRTASIAYKVTHGVAMSVGDPCGPGDTLKPLIRDFLDLCFLNGWACAFIHTEERLLKIYRALGLETQKLGDEAIVRTSHFMSNVVGAKYFRQIENRFIKLDYSSELLHPPHNQAVIDRLEEISNDWLDRPGRGERTFMLGYFRHDYIQACDIFVARDNLGKIQAFLNVVASPKFDEANYDFLRHASDAPGNINDYVMMNFIKQLHNDGIAELNMGLCPLAGLDKNGPSRGSFIDGILSMVYTKAGRFYSFQGLARFKQKYEPAWQSRYIIYQGGPAGFGRTMNALLKAMTR